MKTVLRNLFSLIRRFRLASMLNILGLSIAYAVFIILMIQIKYELNYDKEYPEAENIFRLEIENGNTHDYQAVMCRPFIEEFLNSSPHIKAGTFNSLSNHLFFSIENGKEQNNYYENILSVSADFPKVFGMTFLEGDEKSLEVNDNVIIPRSLKEKWFGKESALGHKLTFPDGAFYIISGVYEDFPVNSSMNNIIYSQIHPEENKGNWENWNYTVYALIDDPKNAQGIIDNFIKYLSDKDYNKDGGEMPKLRLSSLSQLHFQPAISFDSLAKSSKSTLIILLTIGIVIILIAAINFTNFSTAIAPMRLKSINVQKVLGSKTSALKRALIFEAAAVSVLAYLISLEWVYLFSISGLRSLLSAVVYLEANPEILILTFFISLLTGILAGIYPAFYMTSFPPAIVLKGSFGLSPKGIKIRNALVGLQFVATFILIISSILMYLQNYYMHNTSLGYDKDAVIVTDLNNKTRKKFSTIADDLKRNPLVKEVTFSQALLSSGDSFMSWGRDYKEININFYCLPVDPSFLKVMNIPVLEGRDFRKNDSQTSGGALIFNRKAQQKYNLEIGTKINDMEIIGIIPDVKYASLRSEVAPMAFFVWGTNNWGSDPNYMYIQLVKGANLKDALSLTRDEMKKFDFDFPFNIVFFDDVLNNLYDKEQKMTMLITLFSIIAILISVFGVFGLVVFESEYRKKEIGLRKVMGATTKEILIMFNKTYIKVLLICFVIAVPVATYAINMWLNNFAYKTPLYWWIYVVAFLFVSIFTLLIVTFQTWKTANSNPVESIKSE